MDLISRQVAIDAIWDGINMDIYTREVKEILEALPSAEPDAAMCWGCNCPKMPDADLSEYSDKLWKTAYERGKAEAHPNGKWKHRQTWSMYVCDHCSFENHEASKYCPNCGARMEESE